MQVSAELFVEALARQDFARLAELLAPDVQFRALLPERFEEHEGASAFIGRFTDWYGDADHLELLASNTGRMGDRDLVRFRFRLHDPDGWSEIEQHLICDGSGGAIERVDLLCSGFIEIDPRS